MYVDILPIAKGAKLGGYQILEKEDISYLLVKGLSGWINTSQMACIGDEDALMLMIKYPGSFAIASYRDANGPDDDEEVEILCWDCGGKVFSVSGYEFKNDERLRMYRCNKINSVCEYEVAGTNVGKRW